MNTRRLDLVDLHIPGSYVEVVSDVSRIRGGAPIDYAVRVKKFAQELYGAVTLDQGVLARILFQNGPIRSGINGLTTELLLVIALDRLIHFQLGRLHCNETQQAIDKLREALMWLRLRVERRSIEGKLGTDIM